MAPLYKKALVIGASSGIGQALAEKLLSVGTDVVVVGRRADRLDALVKQHSSGQHDGPGRIASVRFDVTQLEAIPQFAEDVTKSHPDIDCIVVNSGIQRALDFTKPESLDLAAVVTEVTTNYTSAVYLTAAFLPHLRTKDKGHLVYVGATLGLVPGLVRTPNYNASKAALHSFIMATRQQLEDAGQENMRLVEVFPPAVQTELHNTEHQPDLVNGHEIGMPLDKYTEAMYDGLVRGDDQFAIGPGEELLREDGWETERTRRFKKQHETLKTALQRYIR
jgi:short-subunit dehydrogenase involved in D-alanine esterification of teichoic acids